MTRSHLRLASVVGAIVLSGVAMAPALGATNLSSAGANALTISVAGNENGTGNVTATNDGSGEKKTGDTAPPVSVLQGQKLLNVGVLAQEASATAPGGKGRSAACAGIAGNGGSVAQIGDSSCLNPGEPVGLSLTNLDLSDTLVVDPDSALGPLAEANDPLQDVLSQITTPLADAIADTPLGTTGITGTLGTVEGRCTASPGTASGTANIVDSKLILDVAGQKVVLANLPAHPAPNTDVPINLDKATAVILGAVKTQLTTMLAADGTPGPLAPLGTLTDTLQDQVITALVDATREQLLTPLSDNVLKLTLNKQVRPTKDSIRVNAIDLQVLPVAQEQLGASLASAQIGNVVCGPSGREVTAAPQAAPAPKAAPRLPTAVSAGYGEMPAKYAPEDNDRTAGFVLAAFAALVATGAGAVTFRRLRR